LSLIIYPETFEPARLSNDVVAFFTGKEPGIDVSGVSDMPVYFPIQKHTADVTVLEADTTPVVADAVVTNRKGILIGIKVADCVPILLYDPVRKAVGAAHAGWRGTAHGILKKTVEAMRSTFGTDPADLVVAIGPAIRWCCYEVGREVLDAVVAATGEGDYHMEKDGKLCLDLQSANKYQALSVKIQDKNISITEECTFCYPDRYFSYRYTKGTGGRQGGFIGMP